MKNLIQRSLTGVIYVALIVSLIMFGGTWGFPLLCCLLALLGVIEFFRMTDTGGGFDITYCFDLLGSLLVASLPLWYTEFGMTGCITAMLIYVLARMILQLYTHDYSPASRLAGSFMSLIYVSAPIAIASMLILRACYSVRRS